MLTLVFCQPIETNIFEIIYQIDVKNSANTIQTKSKYNLQIDDVEGFAIWYLNDLPRSANDFHSNSFGYKTDFSGLGVYVFKHEGKWRVIAIYNQGLQGMSIEAAVANLSKYFHYGLVTVLVFKLNLTTAV